MKNDSKNIFESQTQSKFFDLEKNSQEKSLKDLSAPSRRMYRSKSYMYRKGIEKLIKDSDAVKAELRQSILMANKSKISSKTASIIQQ